MKVKLLPERCIACGLCQTYSDQFDYHDDGIVKFTDSEALEKDCPASPGLDQAIKECPTHALIKE